MSKQDYDEKMPSLWLNVFHNSKVNGAEYREDRLPSHPWSWPTDTYLQRRLRAVRAKAADEPVNLAQDPTLQRSASRDEAAAPQRRSRSATRRSAENPNRPTRNRAMAKGNGLVIEWDNIDERLARFARPNNK